MLSDEHRKKLTDLIDEAETNGEDSTFIQNELIPAFKSKYDVPDAAGKPSSNSAIPTSAGSAFGLNLLKGAGLGLGSVVVPRVGAVKEALTGDKSYSEALPEMQKNYNDIFNTAEKEHPIAGALGTGASYLVGAPAGVARGAVSLGGKLTSKIIPELATKGLAKRAIAGGVRTGLEGAATGAIVEGGKGFIGDEAGSGLSINRALETGKEGAIGGGIGGGLLGAGMPLAAPAIKGVGRGVGNLGKFVLKGEAKINDGIAKTAGKTLAIGRNKIISDVEKYNLQSTRGGFSGVAENAGKAIDDRMESGAEILLKRAKENPDLKINGEDVFQNYMDKISSKDGGAPAEIPFDKVDEANDIIIELTKKLKKHVGIDEDAPLELGLKEADEVRKMLSQGVFKKGAYMSNDPIRDQVKQDMAMAIRDAIEIHVPEHSQANREIRDLINVKNMAESAQERISKHNPVFSMGNYIAAGLGAAGGIPGTLATVGAKKAFQSGRGASALISTSKGLKKLGESLSGRTPESIIMGEKKAVSAPVAASFPVKNKVNVPKNALLAGNPSDEAAVKSLLNQEPGIASNVDEQSYYDYLTEIKNKPVIQDIDNKAMLAQKRIEQQGNKRILENSPELLDQQLGEEALDIFKSSNPALSLKLADKNMIFRGAKTKEAQRKAVAKFYDLTPSELASMDDNFNVAGRKSIDALSSNMASYRTNAGLVEDNNGYSADVVQKAMNYLDSKRSKSLLTESSVLKKGLSESKIDESKLDDPAYVEWLGKNAHKLGLALPPIVLASMYKNSPDLGRINLKR